MKLLKVFVFSVVVAAMCGSAFGQGVFSPPQTAFKIVNGLTTPIAGATVTVCAGSTGGFPCSPPLASALFKDAALTVPLSNPFFADAFGNYQFAIAPGTYTVTVTATGFTGQSYQVSLSSGSSSGGGVSSVFGRSGIVTQQTGDYTFGQIGAGSTQGLTFTGKPWIDVTTAGAVCDDVTDDTAAVVSALTTLYNQNGGTLAIPPGKLCKVTGQITLPNTGASTPLQPPIRITSFGNGNTGTSAGGSGNNPPAFAGLDLTNNSATAKIDTRGAGTLEIDHILLKDSASDCAAFIFTTNTILKIHDATFIGTASGTSACNDGIIFGGTSTTINGASTSPFQGYGTVVDNNIFQKIQRVEFFQTYANGIQTVNNTVWNSCGSATHGTFEMAPLGGNSDTGNFFAGNLIEITNYEYAFWFNGGAVGNVMVGNNLFDWSATNVAGYRFETSATNNLVIDGWDSNLTTPVSDGSTSGVNTFLTAAAGIASIFPQPQIFTNAGTPIQIKRAGTANNYDILNTTTSDEFYQIISSASGQPTFQWQRKPNGGAVETWFRDIRTATTDEFTFGGPLDTTLFLEGISGADVKLRSLGSSVVWLCGANVCSTWADVNGTLNNTALVQGKRFGTAKAGNLVTGDFALGAGWGSTASPTLTVTTSRDQAWVLTITTGGAGIAANPTLQITFHDGSWNNVPVCRATQTGGNDITSNMSVTARSATSYTWQWTGTPTTAKTYEITADCWGT